MYNMYVYMALIDYIYRSVYMYVYIYKRDMLVMCNFKIYKGVICLREQVENVMYV